MLDSAPVRGSKTPGSYWLYSNWDFNAAGGAFEKMTGKDIFDALRDDIAVPIGMQDFVRARQQKRGDPRISRYMAYHMWFSTRDMARLGLLMLRNGRWNETQVIPAAWVKESTTILTKPSEYPESMWKSPFGYGYMWWVWSGNAARGPFKGAYTSSGAYGQYITILPALDMVVAHKVQPVNRGIGDAEYFTILDRLVGRRPASEVVLPVLFSQGVEAGASRYREILKRPNGLLADELDMMTSGLALMRTGDNAKAAKVFELTSKVYPASFRVLVRLSQAQAAMGMKYTARATAEKAFAMAPRYALTKVQLMKTGGEVDGRRLASAPVAGLQALAGDYRDEKRKILLKVSVQDGRLLVQAFDDEELVDEYSAFPIGAGKFYAVGYGMDVTFASGTMSGKDDGVEWSAKRLP